MTIAWCVVLLIPPAVLTSGISFALLHYRAACNSPNNTLVVTVHYNDFDEVKTESCEFETGLAVVLTLLSALLTAFMCFISYTYCINVQLVTIDAFVFGSCKSLKPVDVTVTMLNGDEYTTTVPGATDAYTIKQRLHNLPPGVTLHYQGEQLVQGKYMKTFQSGKHFIAELAEDGQVALEGLFPHAECLTNILLFTA